MPWKPGDAKDHTELADTPEKQEKWATTANNALKQCLAKEGNDPDECEASAIRIANASLKEADVGGKMTAEEAATIKSQAQGLLRALDALLKAKQVPDAIRDKAAALRKDLGKAWKAVKSDADADAGDADAGKAAEAQKMDVAGDIIPLLEAGIGDDGTFPVKLIQPGWGSSGHYSEETLQASAGAFQNGLHMYWDHPTAEEEDQRPERSLRDLAAVLVQDAAWVDDPVHGPGLYAKAKAFHPYRETLAELAPHIGVSIRGQGLASKGQAEDREGLIIERITDAASVDFVTKPGAGGELVQLFEAARSTASGGEDNMGKTEELEQANVALTKEVATLRTDKAKLMAVGITAKAVAESELPQPAKLKITEALAKADVPLVEESGELDADAWTQRVEEAITTEQDYVSKLADDAKTVKGMGPSGSTQVSLQAAFQTLYEAQGFDSEQAKQLSEVAAK